MSELEKLKSGLSEVNKLKSETKSNKTHLMVYQGNVSARDSRIIGSPLFWEMHGLKFETGIVTPVTEDVYDYIKHIHLFSEVFGIGSVTLDWPKK